MEISESIVPREVYELSSEKKKKRPDEKDAQSVCEKPTYSVNSIMTGLLNDFLRLTHESRSVHLVFCIVRFFIGLASRQLRGVFFCLSGVDDAALCSDE